MKTKIAMIVLLGLSFAVKAQDDTVNGNLTVNGTLKVSSSSNSTNFLEADENIFRLRFGSGLSATTIMEAGILADNGFKINLPLTAKQAVFNGNVGVGVTNPLGKLHVNYPTSAGDISKNGIIITRPTTATSDVTSHDKAIYAHAGYFSVAPGVTDSGYKIGVDASAYSLKTEFQGTLKSNYGIWARAGIYQASSGARINNAVAVEAQVLDNIEGTSIDNIYGVRINTGGYNKATVTNRYDLYAGTTNAKNYFGGNVGIGINSPEAKLQIVSPSTIGGSDLTKSALLIGTSSLGIGIDTNEFMVKGQSFYFGTLTNHAIHFRTGGTNTRMTLRGDSGNFGIGTTSPIEKLEVTGNILSSGTISLGKSGSANELRDVISLYGNRLGASNMYGFGVESDGTLYNKAVTHHRWYLNSNANLGTSAKMELDSNRLFVNNNVGIGTGDTKGYNLAVAGSTGIIAEKVTVKLQSAWPDYVFANDYQLPTLEEVEKQIKEKGHLANIPSAREVQENGVELGDMNKKLLEKVEELTLYTIQQEKEIKKLKEENKQLKSLEERLAKLEALLQKK
ncbi:hypothetical protein ACOSP6_07400 [Tenacibaculum sp. MEBiC06402]|uniref:hypothetical protein n=1 Tax=unclassified Tenacibaculum TaxID=2635139 RepID=UPI003B9BB27E